VAGLFGRHQRDDPKEHLGRVNGMMSLMGAGPAAVARCWQGRCCR